MNVRIFWVRAMKCMYAQTRPRFTLSSKGVLGGMEFEPMLTPREKSRLPKMSPEEDRTRDTVDGEPKHYQLSYSGPHINIWKKTQCWNRNTRCKQDKLEMVKWRNQYEIILGPVSWRRTTIKWQQFSQSNRHSAIGTRQAKYHEALPSSANDEVKYVCTFVDDGNASWYSVCGVPMVEWRLDCGNCRHLTVVSFHDTDPWRALEETRKETYTFWVLHSHVSIELRGHGYNIRAA